MATEKEKELQTKIEEMSDLLKGMYEMFQLSEQQFKNIESIVKIQDRRIKNLEEIVAKTRNTIVF